MWERHRYGGAYVFFFNQLSRDHWLTFTLNRNQRVCNAIDVSCHKKKEVWKRARKLASHDAQLGNVAKISARLM